MELDKALALKALSLLDKKIHQSGVKEVILVIGGGGAMLLQHNYLHGTTYDIDAVPLNYNFEDLKPFMEEVAHDLKIAPDWLNPYYQSFTIYLPSDAKSRMQTTFEGKSLKVKSLGAEEILIMKLMAGRSKDLPHIKHLLKFSPNLSIVENRLEELINLFPKEAKRALNLLDDITGDEL